MMDIPAAAPTRGQACLLAEAEYAALLTMLRGLDDPQWAAPTECAPWSVRDLVAHLAGAADEAVHLRVQLRHLRAAKARIGEAEFVDVLNEEQLADRTGRPYGELLAELTELAIHAPKARMRTPWFIRRRPLPIEAGGPAGDTLAYLLDVIYTRDIWMHRIDIARATGCELVRSEVEDAVVEQVMRDLDRTWTDDPVRIELTGRVSGTWSIGGASPTTRIALDAVAACRLWSGRSDETGLQPDSPVHNALLSTRLLF